jgi:hypothetical protein
VNTGLGPLANTLTNTALGQAGRALGIPMSLNLLSLISPALAGVVGPLGFPLAVAGLGHSIAMMDPNSIQQQMLSLQNNLRSSSESVRNSAQATLDNAQAIAEALNADPSQAHFVSDVALAGALGAMSHQGHAFQGGMVFGGNFGGATGFSSTGVPFGGHGQSPDLDAAMAAQNQAAAVQNAQALASSPRAADQTFEGPTVAAPAAPAIGTLTTSENTIATPDINSDPELELEMGISSGSVGANSAPGSVAGPGPGNASAAGPGTGPGVGGANDAATSAAAADAAAATAASTAATATAESADVSEGGGAAAGGGGGGGGGGGCYMATWTLDALQPKEAATAKRILREFKAQFLKAQPEAGPRAFALYQGIARKIMAAADAAGPGAARKAQETIYREFIQPLGAHVEAKEVGPGVQRLVQVTRALAGQFHVPIPATPSTSRFIALHAIEVPRSR